MVKANTAIFLSRKIENAVVTALQNNPVVALIGPRLITPPIHPHQRIENTTSVFFSLRWYFSEIWN